MSKRTGIDEQKEALTFRQKIECKNCRFFVRVSGEGAQTHLRGFCLKGMNNGEFGLYLSASYASECPSFVFNEENAKITEFENNLNGIKDKYFRKGERDARKMLKNNPDMKLKYNPFQSMLMGNSLGWERFVSDHRDDIIKLSDMAQLKHRDYWTLLNFVQTKMFQFVTAHVNREE